MKSKDVKINGVYVVKVAGQLTLCKLTGEYLGQGWVGTNLKTGRQIRLRTGGRLRAEHPGKGFCQTRSCGAVGVEAYQHCFACNRVYTPNLKG